MKKFFFFRSSVSTNGSNKDLPPSSAQEEVYWENPSETGRNASRGLFSKSGKVSNIKNSSDNHPALRRSRSMSSAAYLGVEVGKVDLSSPRSHFGSPSSTRSGVPDRQYDHSVRADTREMTKHSEVLSSQNLLGVRRPGSGCSSRTHKDSLGSSSSTCSSYVSGKILDRYIDGEQQHEKSRSDYGSQGNFAGNGGFRRPPRGQYTAPSSPGGSINDKAHNHSVREPKSSRLRCSSRDWADVEFAHQTPRRLAKNVVERLSQSRTLHNSSQKEIDHEMPVTLEDIYGGSINRCFDSKADVVGDERNYSVEEPFDTINKYNGEEDPYYSENFSSKKSEDEVDVDLERRSKEAEETVMLLSEELEQEIFFQDCGFDVPSLIQTIRNMAEDRVSLAVEVSSRLHAQIAERTSFKEELGLAKTELQSQTRRLEKEKNELQSALERELDRRSSEWSSKLEKYQSEERRLRERVRELAEQNVSLQREVLLLNERDSESRKKATHLEEEHKELSKRVEDVDEANRDLQKYLGEFQEIYRSLEAEHVCLQANFESKEIECKELHKSITRLVRTCGEHDKTISGLREAFSEELGKNQPTGKSDMHLVKFQEEQMRLIGVEQALRRELESFRVEVDTLRHENMNLLNRLKGNVKESEALTLSLDKEMWTRVCCLQNQGLSMLNDASQLCSKLVAVIKERLVSDVRSPGLDGHFVIESEMKHQGLIRGVENFTRSLQKIATLLHDKSNLSACVNQSTSVDRNDSVTLNPQSAEGAMKYELKAETLLTSLLREKLYSKEQEVEQLQAELATAVRGADILQYEVQNALDQLSFVTHNLKDRELQMLKKDESYNRVQTELQESNKELAVMKGILPKISGERDAMWDKVKKCSEENMLMNSEINALKTKIEAQEEEILIKEGQITILKDSIGSKRLDLLDSPDYNRHF